MLTPEQRLENKRASQMKYHRKNAEANRKKSLAYYYANRETRLALSKERRIRGQSDTGIFVSEMARSSKSSARERNIPFHLTKEDIKGFLIASNGICSVSGLRMDTVLNSQMKASIDRIDSTKGYTMDNVQIVAGCVNRAKNALSQKDFITMCKSIAKVNV